MYFSRSPNGGVHVVKHVNEKIASDVLFDEIIPPQDWAEIVAEVSHLGQNKNTYYSALEFHDGKTKT